MVDKTSQQKVSFPCSSICGAQKWRAPSENGREKRTHRSGTARTNARFDADGFITVREFARLYAVDPRTVRNWIKRGKVSAVRIGHIVRISRSSLKQFPKE